VAALIPRSARAVAAQSDIAAQSNEQPVPVDPRADGHCLRCGAELADDQEWCVECGAARTLIHRPPDWRVPVVVVGAVIVLVLAAFLIAVISLSS